MFEFRPLKSFKDRVTKERPLTKPECIRCPRCGSGNILIQKPGWEILWFIWENKNSLKKGVCGECGHVFHVHVSGGRISLAPENNR
jgi:ribosomal protein S27AE